MSEHEIRILEKLNWCGGVLVRVPTPYSFKYWVELKIGGNENIDYNKGVTAEFIEKFEFIKTDNNNRSFFKLKPNQPHERE